MRATESRERGAVLLPLARAAIAHELGRPHTADDSAPWLQDSGACFVTLTQGGDLRGCIGTLQAHRPLLSDVRANALAAAFRDPRFAPLSARELERTEVEVSLLSPMQALQVGSEAEVLAQLRPGIDGVVFEFGARRSTFLPQVWEQLPAVDDFMAHLKRKAGLPAGFWHAEVRLQRYTVSKWKESELALEG
jgi:AmmeMemoRadiSam system protein A